MEITKQQTPGAWIVGVTGRLDASTADALDRELADVVRAGARRVQLDASGVDFLSSAGIRILIKSGKDLKAIGGLLEIVNPSDAVYRVLELSGLLDALNVRASSSDEPSSAPEEAAAPEAVTLEAEGCKVIVTPLPGSGGFRCRLVGRPGDLAEGRLSADALTTLPAGVDDLVVGIGALGDDPRGAGARCGEILAAGGAAIHQPSGKASAPDYLLAAGAFVPQVQALYALACRGAFSHALTFERADPEATLSLAGLTAAALSAVGADAVAVLIIAESAGLVGASMKQSPTEPGDGAFFDFPGIRRRVSFTPDVIWPRSLALVVGVAARKPDGALDAFLRPIGDDCADLHAHYHAAAFAYRAMPVTLSAAETAVGRLFDVGGPDGALHLLRDDRGSAGAGDSRFVRGAAWIAPITACETEAPGKEGPA